MKMTLLILLCLSIGCAQHSTRHDPIPNPIGDEQPVKTDLERAQEVLCELVCAANKKGKDLRDAKVYTAIAEEATKRLSDYGTKVTIHEEMTAFNDAPAFQIETFSGDVYIVLTHPAEEP